jgi:hypothetical protein
MKKLNTHDVFALLCKSAKKWGVMISFSPTYSTIQDIAKAAPYLKYTEDSQIIGDGWGVILCETEAEMENIFWSTVGDDGPTKLNSYDGNFRVYALTCDPEGQLLNENT